MLLLAAAAAADAGEVSDVCCFCWSVCRKYSRGLLHARSMMPGASASVSAPVTAPGTTETRDAQGSAVSRVARGMRAINTHAMPVAQCLHALMPLHRALAHASAQPLSCMHACSHPACVMHTQTKPWQAQKRAAHCTAAPSHAGHVHTLLSLELSWHKRVATHSAHARTALLTNLPSARGHAPPWALSFPWQ